MDTPGGLVMMLGMPATLHAQDCNNNGIPDVIENPTANERFAPHVRIDSPYFVNEANDIDDFVDILVHLTSGTNDERCAADGNRDSQLNETDTQALMSIVLTP